jgi:hypothetical protein
MSWNFSKVRVVPGSDSDVTTTWFRGPKCRVGTTAADQWVNTAGANPGGVGRYSRGAVPAANAGGVAAEPSLATGSGHCPM